MFALHDGLIKGYDPINLLTPAYLHAYKHFSFHSNICIYTRSLWCYLFFDVLNFDKRLVTILFYPYISKACQISAWLNIIKTRWMPKWSAVTSRLLIARCQTVSRNVNNTSSHQGHSINRHIDANSFKSITAPQEVSFSALVIEFLWA